MTAKGKREMVAAKATALSGGSSAGSGSGS
jgi:hypothetical protein